MLRNDFGVDSQPVLSDLEFVATAGRMVGWPGCWPTAL